MNTRETRRIVNLEKSIKMLEEKVSALEKENESLKDDLKIQSNSNGKLNDRIAALTKRNDEISSFIQKDLQNSQNDIQDSKKSLQSLQQNVVDIKKQIDELNDTIHNITASVSTPTTPEFPKPYVPSAVDIMNYKPYLSPDGSINYKIKDKPHHVPPKVVKTALVTTTLKEFFKAFSLPIKDNRSKGGALWVKGSPEELAPFVGIAGRKFACTGFFTSNGQATGFQIGWFTNCRR